MVADAMIKRRIQACHTKKKDILKITRSIKFT
jgi:hypothetical protein